jgi:hypothetical protein
MKQAKKSKPKEEPFTVKIDPGVLARINAKIAKAHEQTDSPYVYKRPKPVVKPAIRKETEDVVEVEPEPVIDSEIEPLIKDDAEGDI